MDKRKGILAGLKRSGPVNRFLFWGLVISLLFNIIQLFTGATKSRQETAQIDRDTKYAEQTEQLFKIDSEINTKNRPYIGVEKFALKRNNNSFTPIDSITIHLRNYGDIPANNVNIYFDIFDEADIRRKIEKFPFRNTIVGDFVIMPKDRLAIDNRSLNTGVISDKARYEEWAEKVQLVQMNERLKYYKEHERFPRQDIVYAVVEIKYRGLEQVEELPFSLRAVYSPNLRDGNIVWESNNSEVQ